jgi:hypothetical protein
MASGDFQDLYEKAIYASRRDITDTFDVARAKAAINEALAACSFTGDPWNWLEKEGQFTLTAGSDTYTLAAIGTAIGTTLSDIFDIVIDTSDSGGRLQPMSWEALENISDSTQDGESSGTPAYFASWDGRIRFFPSPDRAYVLGCFYRAYQSELSATSDTPLIPLEWRTRLLVPYAASVLLRQEGGGEAGSEADRYYALYQGALRECRTALATAKQPAMALMSPSWPGE